MTFAEYAADVRRTYAAGSPREGLAMCALGLCGEAGEVADHIKKHLHHKHPLDKAAVTEELGDVLFYIVGMAHEIGTTLDDVVAANVAKRQARYPDGFDPQRSMERGDEKRTLSEWRKLGWSGLDWPKSTPNFRMMPCMLVKTTQADDVEELPEGQSYYGHRFVATVQGIVGTGPAPADAVNRALAHRSYRRDPDEWLAARRKRRAMR